MNPDTPSDDELLLRLPLHPEAMGPLFERHSGAVHRFLSRRVGAQAAEDLLAEVFVAAVSARVRVRPHASGSALPWLYGIARNVIRAHLRSRPRPAGWPVDDDIDWAAVDERIDALGRRDELRRVLAVLTADEREVLLLVAWNGLTPAESAALLGITAEAARSRLARARRRAQHTLDTAAVIAD
ncbi:RNA polymerase sigma factor [Cellulomonas soli]|uniref:DNA-directed RNA polymerase sigma-70 factor n=1 Tax=Cellulomonas soli TaxID=931535 RepID=A0A512PDT7_9CELL|nr:sigma-70 family RNA polymerase sigma factor [Cellulomonas soli]NYI59131.1 RNA polymerase sigma-70 factor (ECF subfamily) [Cellulomonas soli]GEP69377.1 DNA-directed RNA polymerase sigma-70 factor [Cellulomonas soli]